VTFFVASHFAIRHFKSYNTPPKPLSLSHLTVHPVLLLTFVHNIRTAAVCIFCI